MKSLRINPGVVDQTLVHSIDIGFLHMALHPICEPWRWYIKTYIYLGDFGQGQMLVNIPAPWFAYAYYILCQ